MPHTPFFGLTKRILVIDTETCSRVDLKVRGSDVYFAHPSTRCLMVGFKEVGGPETRVWQPHLHATPPAVLQEALRAPPEDCLIAAYNAAFDRQALARLGLQTPIEKWLDIMLLAYLLAFAGGLDDVLKQFEVVDEQGNARTKSKDGKRLITQFSKQQTPWFDDPEAWHRFVQYCQQDVEVEHDLLMKCAQWLNQPFLHPQVQTVHRQWQLDQRMNARGMPVSARMIAGAKAIRTEEVERLTQRIRALSGIDNPNSLPQMNAWLQTQGVTLDNLQAATIQEAVQRPDLPATVKEVLRSRIDINSKAVKKYDSFEAMQVRGRIRNGITTYGASRTGRTASRGVNLANLKRPTLKAEDQAWCCDLIEQGSLGFLNAMRFGPAADASPMEVLGSCVRGAIAAPPGHGITAMDLKSIESVGLAWLAGCDTILDLFHEGRDTYKAFAALLYGIAYEAVTKAQRSFCKPPVLGCFAEETLVRTDRGDVPIVEVRPADRVWDGEQWVTHGGVIERGLKKTINALGVRATPDHPVRTGPRWTIWQEFVFWNPWTVETEVPVYDILDAGPRHRFTIQSASGPLIVHNCGYGLSAHGLIAYAKGMGVDLSENEAERMVATFRQGYPEIPAYWKVLDAAAKAAIQSPGTVHRATAIGRASPVVVFYCDGTFLHVRLPSERTLFYYRPQLKEGVVHPANGGRPFQVLNISYMGRQQDTGGGWTRVTTHPGKITENLVQAVCRDILYHGLDRIEQDPDLELIGSTYDEAICLTPLGPRGDAAFERLKGHMTARPPWLDERFYLGCDGYLNAPRYRKD